MLIEQLSLITVDLVAQRNFYCGTLELKEASGAQNRLVLAVGRSQLVFEQAEAGWQSFYHLAFLIPRNQFTTAKTWLESRLTLLRNPEGADQLHFDNWNSDSVYFLDPAGNILEFIARHDLNNDVSEPFSAADIISVNEISLVCDDVLETVETLRREYGLESYLAHADEQFTPVGDSEGLLIVAKRGRCWLPDLTKAAVPAPLQLRLQTIRGEQTYDV
jgi:catechol-2,3-dioxygenase